MGIQLSLMDIPTYFVVMYKLKLSFRDWRETKLKTEEWADKVKIKKISNDQELIQSDPISCPQNQKGNK